MAEPSQPREVRGAEVRCTGPAETPHEERRLVLPDDREVTCPECGCAYRRARGWLRMFEASWPKPE